MRRVIFAIVVITSLFIIKDLITSIWTLYQKQDLLMVTQKDLAKQKREHALLKTQLQTVQKRTFIEAEARNKLLLVQPGEKLVIVPSTTPKPEKEKSGEKQNWQKWVSFFFDEQ